LPSLCLFLSFFVFQMRFSGLNLDFAFEHEEAKNSQIKAGVFSFFSLSPGG
jgi:hypothetical protein